MKYLGIIIALFLGVLAFITVYQANDDGSSEPVQVVTTQEPDYREVEVLVAARRISVGEKIDASMLESQPWPEHLVVSNFITHGGESQTVIGKVARSYFQPGEPLISSKLANPKDPGFIAANLSEGKRMMTISTDGVAGLAGFLYPGDYVDLMVTHPIPKDELAEDGSEQEETVTESFLQNVKVLAVDQRATSEQNPDQVVDLPSSVSLEVSLEDAQRIRLAQDLGYVSLALRDIGSDAKVDTGVTRQQDVSSSDVFEKIKELKEAYKKEQEAASEEKDVIKIIRGTTVEEIETPASPEEESAEVASVP